MTTKQLNTTEISGFIIERTAKRMKQAFQKMLNNAGVDITVDQWVILNELRKENALSQFELATRTYKDAPTVTRIIDKLVNKKLLKRAADTEDRRKFKIKLTPKGDKLIIKILPILKQHHANAWSGLGQKKIVQIMESLNHIFDNLENI